jgi:NhaP-type Na+/H+ or K+/H+ antiporter
MEWSLAVVALALIAFGTISRRVEGTPVTPAMIFVGVGLLVGAQALDLLETSPTGEAVKVLAEATLALVLFADASRINLRTLRQEYSVPTRLLGFGLPLTIALGTVLAAALFGVLSIPEAVVLADPAGSERRERAERRDLRAAALHRPRRGGGGCG